MPKEDFYYHYAFRKDSKSVKIQDFTFLFGTFRSPRRFSKLFMYSFMRKYDSSSCYATRCYEVIVPIEVINNSHIF